MNPRPRDPALAALVDATVRVNGGSGFVLAATADHARVIVTAQHVIAAADRAQPIVRWIGGAAQVDVHADGSAADVAIIGEPKGLDVPGLSLCESDDVAVGDDVWLAGYPKGWAGTLPVLARGSIAGVDAECWINMAGSWGHSGGPVVVVRDGQAQVVGYATGAAGDPSEHLDAFLRVNRTAKDRSDGADLLAEGRASPDHTTRLMAQVFTLIQGSASTMHLSLEGAALLIQEHFRAGFLRVTTARDIRRLRG